MTPPLDRIHKLIALALKNPSEHEARSAALKALQLIAAYGVQLSLPTPAPASRPSTIRVDDLRHMWERRRRDDPQPTPQEWDGWERFRDPDSSRSGYRKTYPR